jgi:hypothetical protein
VSAIPEKLAQSISTAIRTPDTKRTCNYRTRESNYFTDFYVAEPLPQFFQLSGFFLKGFRNKYTMESGQSQ